MIICGPIWRSGCTKEACGRERVVTAKSARIGFLCPDL